MKILRAQHLGMCFGVRDAIDLASSMAAESNRSPDNGQVSRLTILGDLVHNATVTDSLREQGVLIHHQLEEVETDTVMITAHGASARTMNRIRDRGLRVVEATCPLVHHAHNALARLVSQGCHPVIIGRRDHVEVRGMTDDLEVFDVVLTDEDVRNLSERERFGIVSQTTQPVDRVHYLVDLIRARFPASEVRFSDTVCRPTKERQRAAVELARQCDAVVVIGGENSNNTRELAATCARFCERVYQVQDAEGVSDEWLSGVAKLGITAGTSTPDFIIDRVEERIRAMRECAPADARQDENRSSTEGVVQAMMSRPA